MIAGLAEWLHSIEPAGAAELESSLERLLPGSPARMRFDGAETLRPFRVHRLRFRGELEGAQAGPLRSLVIKRLSLDRSHHEQRAVRRWLPAVGLGEHGPPLLEVAAASGSRAWHVYEDLGGGTLAGEAALPPRERVRGAVALVAALHQRFVAHPLLAECRLTGLDLGARFFADSVGDANHALVALRRLDELPRAQLPLIERLLSRLRTLAGETSARSGDFAELGWPETLLHGDLWLSNFLWANGAADRDVRLIDWDRAGSGAAIYDLSALLRQFPFAERPWILDAYRDCMHRTGWPWPDSALFERVSESCELARFASCLLWRVLYVLELPREAGPPPAWLFDELLEMERWFAERTTPLVPARSEVSAA